ncbi:MAG: DUF1674 domain-containing protein [Gammaproteobacteria bacterium]|nr:DUF1674 domain-containing protein [Gammaproteobacteria bacterium]
MPDKSDNDGNIEVETAVSSDDAQRETPPAANADANRRPKEIGGREGPDPTRFGDWEKAGRCIDF